MNQKQVIAERLAAILPSLEVEAIYNLLENQNHQKWAILPSQPSHLLKWNVRLLRLSQRTSLKTRYNWL